MYLGLLHLYRKWGEVVCISCAMYIRHQMPRVTVIHPGSDKYMILCGLVLWEEGWNFLWVQMHQEKGHFLSLDSLPGCPRLVMN